MDRKNTLLLTVIAIATLLVAVVGATFAYFTAQQAGPEEAPITVTTSSTNSLVFDKDKTLTINANMENFAEEHVGETREEGTQATIEPSVTFTASDQAKDAQNMCYKIAFIIDDTTFKQYSTANGTSKPELLLKIEKGTTGANQDTASYTELEVVEKLEHKTEVGDESDTTKESGFDITTKTADTYQIPSDGATNYVHKITANAGETVKDKWKITATIINYDFDQKELAGKALHGKIQFTATECTD